ncbi:DEAD/DEAH box helicase [Streptococcus parasanguinis]|uniref:Putative ComF operon protein 1 n=1 Tax=Streptococcus parasanguinis (strain ATCC 15912 / DSM 6778 / CIP 104372 / LMG 14537) TaxID=760570 RepID=F8DEW1_STREP|nr:DEAD/DEAH box helicase [Streptococcus parasanguinis]AEH55034.1 putative ComF operon protein 1 [Streptococcus parasanguinis ATCC 15912]
MKIEDSYGRLLTESQMTNDLKKIALELPAIEKQNGRYQCFRCGSLIDQKLWKLSEEVLYCRACIQLGRIRSDQKLYTIAQQDFEGQEVLNWKGTLTSYQQEVSDGLIQAVKEGGNALVHAVTGAGKTEMMYQVVATAIKSGQAVCIATPRIDVCIELYGRMKDDFSCPISLLHGKSEPYFRTPLVIATTHQLLKFFQAFDLLIIDEVDAFPYVDNPILYKAAQNAIKKGGNTLYLTATSTDELDKKVKKKEIIRYSLPRRFHGNPLVVPEIKWVPKIREKIEKGRIPYELLQLIKKQRQTHYPLLIFVSEIELGQQFTENLKKYFPKDTVGFVSSQTTDRLRMVEEFRNRALTILVSTTILERGVTFPLVDVFVLESNHKLFTKSALVQISGRVGRSKERPTGKLLFLSDGITREMKKAIKEIKEMNQEAGF